MNFLWFPQSPPSHLHDYKTFFSRYLFTCVALITTFWVLVCISHKRQFCGERSRGRICWGQKKIGGHRKPYFERYIDRLWIKWDMINCSKFWSTQFFNCLTPFKQMSLFCQLLENQKSSAVHVFRAVSLLDKKILSARIAIGRQRFWKMSTARHN